MCKNKCKLENKWCKYCRHRGCIFTTDSDWKTVKTCPKRQSQRTISLYELINSVNFYDVMTAMIADREREKVNVLGYAHVFEKLLNMKPTKTEMQLLVRRNKKWGCLDAFGVHNHKEYAIEFVKWSEWLCMNIMKESIETLSPEEIVAGALWEMTYNGYDEESVEEKLQELEDSLEDINEKIENDG